MLIYSEQECWLVGDLVQVKKVTELSIFLPAKVHRPIDY